MILGALELEKKLRALSEMALRQGIEKGISLVQEDAKANCPVYDGELRESIFTEVENKDGKIREMCIRDSCGPACYRLARERQKLETAKPKENRMAIPEIEAAARKHGLTYG